MQIAYWVVAGLLALFFLYSGVLKLVRSRDQLAPMMGWVDTVPMPLVRVIGTVEVLGAAGLLLPPATGIAPYLAVWAALGIVVLQVLAAGLHLSRGEVKETSLNAILIVLAAVAAWLAASVW